MINKHKQQKILDKPPFHKRFALFLGGIGAITTGIYLFTDSGQLGHLIGNTVLILLAIGMWFWGDKY